MYASLFFNMELNDFLGLEFSRGAREKLSKLHFLVRILRPFELNGYPNRYAQEYFFKEVENDIQNLKVFEECYANMSEEAIQSLSSFDGTLINKRNEISKKYGEEYCPCTFFKRLNKSNRIQYMFLRVEIDKLLGIEDTKYKL